MEIKTIDDLITLTEKDVATHRILHRKLTEDNAELLAYQRGKFQGLLHESELFIARLKVLKKNMADHECPTSEDIQNDFYEASEKFY